MARRASKYPTELELEILKILWHLGPKPVRPVRQALAPKRELAYTSVVTIMNIMVEKGYLSRHKTGPSYEYKPIVSESATGRGMVNDLVDRVFDGSAKALMVNMLESKELSRAEILSLRELLDDKTQGDK